MSAGQAALELELLSDQQVSFSLSLSLSQHTTHTLSLCLSEAALLVPITKLFRVYYKAVPSLFSISGTNESQSSNSSPTSRSPLSLSLSLLSLSLSLSLSRYHGHCGWEQEARQDASKISLCSTVTSFLFFHPEKKNRLVCAQL